MRLIEHENNLLKKYLSFQFRDGKRWITFDPSLPVILWNYERCFLDFQSAASYCQGKGGDGGKYRIGALVSILKMLNKVPIRGITEIEEQNLKVLVKQYPIHSTIFDIRLSDALWSGDFIPVMWIKRVCPLSYFKRYYIIEQVNKITRSAGEKQKVIGSLAGLPSALTFLYKAIQRIIEKEETSELLLIGVLDNEEYNPDKSGLPEHNSGLIFYRVNFFDDDSHKKRTYKVCQTNDPCEPLYITYPLFVRYFIKKHILRFYNGSLQVVKPGTNIGHLDLNYFYWDKINAQ